MPIEGVDPTIYMKRNRKIETNPAYIEFFCHGVPVVRLSRCRSHVILTTGGHATTTTKNAINDAMRAAGIQVSIYQRDFRLRYRVLKRMDNGLLFVMQDKRVTDDLTIKLI